MGNTWEVWAYVHNPDPTVPGEGYGSEYFYRLVYQGESKRQVRKAMKRARAAGAGCIRTEWRP